MLINLHCETAEQDSCQSTIKEERLCDADLFTIICNGNRSYAMSAKLLMPLQT